MERRCDWCDRAAVVRFDLVGWQEFACSEHAEQYHPAREAGLAGELQAEQPLDAAG